MPAPSSSRRTFGRRFELLLANKPCGKQRHRHSRLTASIANSHLNPAAFLANGRDPLERRHRRNRAHVSILSSSSASNRRRMSSACRWFPVFSKMLERWVFYACSKAGLSKVSLRTRRRLPRNSRSRSSVRQSKVSVSAMVSRPAILIGRPSGKGRKCN
jgi:hypothetical protein